MIRALASVLLALVLAVPAYAASTVYADRAAWEAAVSGSLYTETFDAVPDQYVPRFVGGTMYTPGFDIVIPAGVVLGTSIRGGFFYGDAEEDSEYTNLGYNDIVFHAPVTAIGFDVMRIEGNQGIAARINGEAFYIRSVVPLGVPFVPFFFGVVFDAPFSTVRINGNHKFYTLDNVSFAPVPEPAGLGALVAVVVAALMVWGRPSTGAHLPPRRGQS